MAAGYLLELFVAPQGEGVLVGTPMLFVRFSGCAVGCRFCDTPHSWPRIAQGVIRWEGEGRNDGSVGFDNPVATEDVVGWASAFRERHPGLAWVSLTGGEPLEQPEFVQALAKVLKTAGWKVYLETAGLHAGALGGNLDFISFISFISMDWKLPSTSGLGDRSPEHAAFLRAMGDVPGQVKAVVSEATSVEEIEAVTRFLRPGLPFILQPITPIRGMRPPGEDALARLAAAAPLPEVRILGQTHRPGARGADLASRPMPEALPGIPSGG